MKKTIFNYHYKTLGKTALIIFLGTLFSAYVTVNIVSSQAVDSLYVGVAAENKEAVIETLSVVKKSPDFATLLYEQKQIYGDDLTSLVFQDEFKQKEQIHYLESVLEKNSSSRDILINLSLLYKSIGNNTAATEYDAKAKTVDPAYTGIDTISSAHAYGFTNSHLY